MFGYIYYGLSEITLYNNYEFANGKCLESFDNFNRLYRHVLLIAAMSYVSFAIYSFLLNVRVMNTVFNATFDNISVISWR